MCVVDRYSEKKETFSQYIPSVYWFYINKLINKHCVMRLRLLHLWCGTPENILFYTIRKCEIFFYSFPSWWMSLKYVCGCLFFFYSIHYRVMRFVFMCTRVAKKKLHYTYNTHVDTVESIFTEKGKHNKKKA